MDLRSDLSDRWPSGDRSGARDADFRLVSTFSGGNGGGWCDRAVALEAADGGSHDMSFHPNDVVRRGRAAGVIVCGVLIFLLSAFFRAQVLKNEQYSLQSEENRLRQIPTAAPRGRILDRNNKPIAENVVGYSVAVLAQREDT